MNTIKKLLPTRLSCESSQAHNFHKLLLGFPSMGNLVSINGF